MDEQLPTQTESPEQHSHAEDEDHASCLHNSLSPVATRPCRSYSVTMSHSIQNLFDNNAMWAEEYTKANPTFFENLSSAQTPEYLWIGCADSRVPAKSVSDSRHILS